MKTIPFLLNLIIIILILSANNFLYSQDKDKEARNYGYSLGVIYGFVYGQAQEYVYPTDTKAEYLSELLWDMKPVLYYGLKADINRNNLMSKTGFFSSVSIKIGVPRESGAHENRDWVSTENKNLTHFSSHTNETFEFYWADAFFGVSIPIASYFYIKPFISGSWMRFAFSGKDGYGKYARTVDGSYYPIDDSPVEYSFEGMNVIRYKQDWFLAAAGFSIGTEILKPLSFELSFHITPLTYCAAKDEHLTNSKTFIDTTSFGLFIEPKGRISLSLQKMEFSLEAAYRRINNTKGPSYADIGNIGSYRLSPNEAGAALSLFDVRFSSKICF